MFLVRGGEVKISYARGVVFRREPEGGILFNVDTGALHIVEEVAVGICSMIDGSATRDQILAELRRRYPEQPDLSRDLDEFLAQLRENGVIV
jgi:hypothetical protein